MASSEIHYARSKGKPGNAAAQLPCPSRASACGLSAVRLELTRAPGDARPNVEALASANGFGGLRVLLVSHHDDGDVRWGTEICLRVSGLGERRYAIVLAVGNREVVLQVDELVDVLTLPIRPLPAHLDVSNSFSGVTTLWDGRVAYILHPLAIIERFASQSTYE